MEEKEFVEFDDIEIEETKDERTTFEKIEDAGKNFINNPVSGVKKVGLILGAIAFGVMAEKHNHKKDGTRLDREYGIVKSDGTVGKMSGRDILDDMEKRQKPKKKRIF